MAVTVIWLVLGGGVVLVGFLDWERHRRDTGRSFLLDPVILGTRTLRKGLLAFFFQYLLQAGLFFAVPLFLSVSLGLSAIGTGVRLLPLSVTLVMTAVGIPRLFSGASPRRVSELGFVALFLGLVVFIALLDVGAGAEITTWPMILAGIGIGALASQLGAVTVASVPDDQSGEVGGLQNTFSNLGISIGTAVSGAVLISALTASLLAGIQNNPSVPAKVSSQAQVQLSSGVPFVSDADLEAALESSGVGDKAAVAIVDENAAARIGALRASLSVLAVLALVALFVSRGLPRGRAPAPRPGDASGEMVSGAGGSAGGPRRRPGASGPVVTRTSRARRSVISAWPDCTRW